MLSQDESRHLLFRTGFYAPATQVQRLQILSRSQAVDYLLSRSLRQLPVPESFNQPPPAPASQPAGRKQQRQQREQLGREMKHWWYQQMGYNSDPLHEQMVLLWHNHFTSSLRKVGWPVLLFRQHRLIRRHALGSFADLLRDMLRDPALLRYLDNTRNRKQAPNENLARELLELFSLGEGQYSEQDIRELARALTGAGVDRQGGYQFRTKWHDSGEKTILGTKKHFLPDDIPALLLAQPACAEHLSRVLWHHFVALTPPPADTISQLAAVLRQHDYQIRPWLRALLLSDGFWHSNHRAALIRSPLELLTALSVGLQLPALDEATLLRVSRGLGQDLFDPPNVKGWPRGTGWIDSVTLSNRQDLLSRSATLAFERHSYAAPAVDPRTVLAMVPLTVDLSRFGPAKEEQWQQLLLDPAMQVK